MKTPMHPDVFVYVSKRKRNTYNALLYIFYTLIIFALVGWVAWGFRDDVNSMQFTLIAVGVAAYPVYLLLRKVSYYVVLALKANDRAKSIENRVDWQHKEAELRRLQAIIAEEGL